MNPEKENEISKQLWNDAYHCKQTELANLLERIELKLKHTSGSNTPLLRAKTVVTTRLLTYTPKKEKKYNKKKYKFLTFFYHLGD